jgi:uncharacterized membrane protein YkgB
MSQSTAGNSVTKGESQITSSTYAATESDCSLLDRIAAWVTARNLSFWVTSVGMIVMLFWAGAFKMTRPGAEGIAPLVEHSPLIWWHFKIFGPYVGGDIIGLTEWLAAVLFIVGYAKPKAGIIGGLITTLMFTITSSMLITTPGTTISVPGIPFMRYMNLLGLFLYKDVIALGASFYLISDFAKRATMQRESTK